MPALIHPDKTQSSLLALKPGEFFVIGSATSADIRLTADGIAPRHARIANDNGLYTLAPLSPKSSVFVNDQYIDSNGHPLVTGDKIQIGEWSLLFDDPNAASPDAASQRDHFAKKRRDESSLTDYERLKRKIILQENQNLKTRAMTDQQMVAWIKKQIEEEAQCYSNR